MAPSPREQRNCRDSAIRDVQDEDGIVISGISGLYPKARSVKEFSENLYGGKNPIEGNTRWQYNHPEHYDYTGEIPEINRFDPQFFRVPFRLTNAMDPMSRVVLEQVYQAIFDAGLVPDYFNGKNVAVYVGSGFLEFDKFGRLDKTSEADFDIVGSSKAMFVNRISFWLNARGPSVVIDTESCSSMTALEQAFRAISSGECEAAIVAGVALNLNPSHFVHYGRIIPLSPDGTSKSFDMDANGTVKSEAATAIILQKAKDAVRVYAEIVHIKTEFMGMWNDETGPEFGFYRNPEKLTDFMNEFYKEAQVSPEEVDYVEGFGSGVPDADKAELEAISNVYCKNRRKPLMVGSVVSNVGFTTAASTVVALTKVLLGYQKGILAANLHCKTPRQDVPAVKNGDIRILNENHAFSRKYAAVNSFSVTGINGILLLKGHYKSKNLSRYKCSIPHLVTVSARRESGVAKILDDLKSRPIDHEEIALLANIHKYSTARHMGRGFVILGNDKRNDTVSLCESVDYYDDSKRPLWFVYSGMGSQWAGMGAQLMRIPIFAAAIERCHQVLMPRGINLVNIITSPDKTIFDNILNSFVGIAAIQIALTDVLTALGLKPDNIIGHSVGEVGCAYADGCLTAEETILSAYSRGVVSLQTPLIAGCMAAVGLGYEQISKLCPPEIDVACHNGPDSSTISGPADVVREFITELTDKGIFTKEVSSSNIAYHSRYITEAGPKLLQYLNVFIKSPKRRSDRWLSTSIPQADWNKPAAKYLSAEYLTNNLLSPVLFEETCRLVPSNAVLVEVAPHGLMQAILKRSLHPDCRHVSLTKRGHSDNVVYLLEAIGKLYTYGYNLKVNVLYPKIDFPVSTETPLLSHLVELLHEEEWVTIIRSLIKTRKSSACNFDIFVHDEEHQYLRGHVVGDQMLYPFASALVAVWDVLAMTIGAVKRQLSVEFRDVQFYSQPLLHDQSSLQLTVTLLRGCGQFEVINENRLVAKGSVFGVKHIRRHKYMSEDYSDLKLDASDVYSLLSERGHHYSGPLQSIYKANISLTKALVLWCDNWATLLDGVIQLNMLKNRAEDAIQPGFIRKICIDIAEHLKSIETDKNGNYIIKAELNKVQDCTTCGGIYVEDIEFCNMPVVHHHSFEVISSNVLSENKNGISLSGTTNITLQIQEKGNFDSLNFVEIPQSFNTGPSVKVHYSGLNRNDINVAMGVKSAIANDELDSECRFGMDFSGVTKSGERVMGVVRGGACSSEVRAQPELLWPVPEHWSLEDAATVPLAYTHAFYCLGIRCVACPGMTVLVHGGAGALGQAAISVALGIGCRVFTTVSDQRKKMFLLKLFPKLNEKHIGSSRDRSFEDLVMSSTNGTGCDIIICCVKDTLKDATLNCCAPYGYTFDVSHIKSEENYSFGMSCLRYCRSYCPVDFATIFTNSKYQEIKALQALMSEGISRGYVRPLSRVTYAPHDAPRAFRLLAASAHRGRVLLNLHQTHMHVQPRFIRSMEKGHLILCNRQLLGLQLTDGLIKRGAKNFIIHYENPPNYLQYKLRCWKQLNVEVKVLTEDLNNGTQVSNFLNKVIDWDLIDGVYVIATNNRNKSKAVTTSLMTQLDSVVRKKCSSMKQFAIISNEDDVDARSICCARSKDRLHAKLVILLASDKLHSVCEDMPLRRDFVEAILNAMCSVETVTLVQRRSNSLGIEQQIANVAGIRIPVNCDDLSLRDLGVMEHKLQSVSALLRANYHVSMEEKEILNLTLKRIQHLEETFNANSNRTRGLETFFSYVAPDDLDATTEMMFVPTLAEDIKTITAEFDTSRPYLCIVPGFEGHYARFRSLYERLKLPTCVLQPDLDKPHETIKQTAERFAKILLKNADANNEFYILGYESGVLIALEVAAILEDHGQSGTIFCIGSGPEEFKATLEEQLSEFETEQQLQNGLVRHMFKLMTGASSAELEELLCEASSWQQKVAACVRGVARVSGHSAQYVRALLHSALARVTQVRQYQCGVPALRSRLVALQPAQSTHAAEHELRQYSRQPLILHQLSAPLAHAAADLRCAAIVNKYLSAPVLQAFESQNLCLSYDFIA